MEYRQKELLFYVEICSMMNELLVSDRNLFSRRELVAEVETMLIDLTLHQAQLPLQLLLFDNTETPVPFDICFPFLLLALELLSTLTEINTIFLHMIGKSNALGTYSIQNNID